ncbi:MAG TPA: MraY family glycosyltransferase [Planctomycetaceae bacterium]|nr:MraY family glycosyltransferase [Planctomycetaceae bacterium]
MASIGLAFCAACALSLLLVPIVRQACERFGLTDQPDSRRKLHKQPVALGGGIVASLATVGAVLPIFLLREEAAASLRLSPQDLIGLFSAGTIIVLLGVLDDAVGLRGRQKLLGQLFACTILVLCGLVIERVQFFGWTIELGLISIPVTLIWLLAAINSINLLDGINGLATTIGIIDSLAIVVLSAMNGHRGHALVAAAFGGSLLGFLRYNFPRAKIFLGDAGSMLIGLMVGALSVQTSHKGSGAVLLAVPLCLLSIPLFDSTAALLRRKLTGRSIFSGDRGHLHHRLTERFGSTSAVGIVALGSGACALAVLASITWRNDMVAVISGGAIIVMFVVSRMFGHSELRLVASRFQSLGRSFLRINGKHPRGQGTHSAVHLQGNCEWAYVWEGLKEAALDLPVNHLELNLNAPMIQEGFHASWARRTADEEDVWRFELPLMAAGHRIGHLRVAGERAPHVPAAELEKILSLFEIVESQLESLFMQSAGASRLVPPASTKFVSPIAPAGSVS